MKKYIEIASLTIILLANFIAVYFLFLSFYPFKTLEVYEPVKVVGSKIVRRGESMDFELTYEKYVNAEVERTRVIICDDGNLVTLSSEAILLPIGSHTLNTNHFIIPAKISNGQCHVQWSSAYHINPLRTIIVTYSSENFTVVP